MDNKSDLWSLLKEDCSRLPVVLKELNKFLHGIEQNSDISDNEYKKLSQMLVRINHYLDNLEEELVLVKKMSNDEKVLSQPSKKS